MHADGYERMTDRALNVLYVLGFISMGDAHTEAGRLLGLCGLPNDTTMKSRSFSMIEERLGPFIRSLCEEVIIDNLIEEVRLSMEIDNNLDYFLLGSLHCWTTPLFLTRPSYQRLMLRMTWLGNKRAKDINIVHSRATEA
jgi:hypothetical protein